MKTKPKGAKSVKLDPVLYRQTVEKLEQAFSIGCSIIEACYYSGISRQTFYNLFGNDNEKLDRFEALRESPAILARKAWINGFNIDPKLARDYMLRKKSGEFGGRNSKAPNEFDAFRNQDTAEDSKKVTAMLEKLGILFPEEKPQFKKDGQKTLNSGTTNKSTKQA